MPKPLSLTKIAWPAARLGELLENLARRARMLGGHERLPPPPDSLLLPEQGEALAVWLDSAAGTLGVETEPISLQYADLHRLLSAGGPAILRIPNPNSSRDPGSQILYLGLLGSRGQRLRLLGPDLRTRRVPTSALFTSLSAPLEGQLGEQVDQLLRDANTPIERRNRARQAILRDQLAPLRIDAGWLLRQPPGASLPKRFREHNLYRPAWVMMGMYFIQQLLTIASWFVIGRGIFQGHFETAWLIAWAILLLFTIPVQVIVSDAQAGLSMGAGAIFKQRLLQGALKLEPEEIRHQGLGQFLGRVMESEAVEMLALSGGFISVLSLIELGLALFILSRSPVGTITAWSLVAWIGLTIFMLWRYARASLGWSSVYREMTNDLVENMVGHRTRLVQENPGHWHDGEDIALERYIRMSEDLDQKGLQIGTLVSRGWIIVGLSGLAVAFVTQAPSASSLAIGLGGVLLAAQGLGKLAGGAQSLSSLMIAWQQVGPLFDAASRPRMLPDLSFVPPSRKKTAETAAVKQAQPLLMARDLSFRYRSEGRPVLQDCTLQIFPGDRLLLEGPSGGGKTTFGALLTGLRSPEIGLALALGLRPQNPRWRGVAQAGGDGASVPGELCVLRDFCVQPADGTSLAANPGRPGRSPAGLRRAWLRRAARAHAFRLSADAGRERLAAFAWRAQPALYRSRPAPACRPDHPR